MDAPSLSCWLIGAEPSLAGCGEVLIRAGHEVRGVITSSPRIEAWARAHQLATFDPGGQIEAVLAQRPFDHLFAITHLARIPDRILRLPRRGAINFHDGPLPEFAGLNAPAWAILQGEKRHAVTWHVMTSALDAGAILKERFFDIAADDTSFSLNAKCFEAALDSFAELVAELTAGTSRPIVQRPERRRVYERHHRPSASCALDWNRSAGELAALVRALDFGRHANPLGMAKLLDAERTVLVTRAEVHAQPSDAALPKPSESISHGDRVAPAPGSVLACDADRIVIATANGSLALTSFAELSGRALEPSEVARRLDLAPGAVLDELSGDRKARLTILDERLSRAEPFWIRRLTGLDPVALPIPLIAMDAEKTQSARATALEVFVPDALGSVFAGRGLVLVLGSAFCAFLARLARRDTFDLGHSDSALRREIAREPWIAARLPLRVQVDLDRSMQTLLDAFAAELAEVRRRGPWLHDLVARTPELHALRDSTSRLLPIGIEGCEQFGAPTLTDGAVWNLEVLDGSTSARACRFVYDEARISVESATSIRDGFEALLASLATQPELALAAHPTTSDEELRRQRVNWNRTARIRRRDVCVHELFREQVARTPEAVALVCEGTSLTYSELARRAEGLANALTIGGMKSGELVGIFVERSIDLVVSVLGVLEAGGAYVPLDPTHPAERLAFMLADTELGVIVTQTRLTSLLPTSRARLVCVDVELARESTNGRSARHSSAQPSDLAYVLYTSGSTGRPKGVQVEHRNVASFFDAMDERIPHDPPGVWLALTSLSFDISVLELLWTLCRGFEVVLHIDDEHARSPSARTAARPIDFSLFYFSSDDDDRRDGYRLLLEGARFADANDFRAVWTPERHFHAFGGLYPNPAVTGAALATITRRIQIRAGSVVLPLHHPIRVAEEWALVDNLSSGRVAVAFASGWHPEDFVLAPEKFAHAKETMFRDIDVVQRLWRGESVAFPGPDGAPIEVRTLPRPLQPTLPMWITCAGNPETYAAAGRIGANVLTHLLGQSVEQLAPKIRAYREARSSAGFDPATGVVTLMLHTFVGEDEARVREQVREPLKRYLASSLSLLKDKAWTFPAFRRPAESGESGAATAEDLTALAAEERAALLAHASDRYYASSGLFGTPERCLEQVARVGAIGVDEIACLIDFGVPTDEVLASLPMLDRVRSRSNEPRAPREMPTVGAFAARIATQRVTHLQCTPSMARILCSDAEVREALGSVRHVFVGGEALGGELAVEFAAAIGGSLTNLYGPTETTIWSSTHAVEKRSESATASSASLATVPIGRPIANTRFHVLDERLQPLPIGVAGELFIAGDGVARGYLRRPELDRERFVREPDALVEKPIEANSRMYRTGDLVRYRCDGVVEFLGRIDHQLKLRGVRVEPAEIEAALLSEDVSAQTLTEAVVVAREDTVGDQRLVAYVVANAAAPDPARLRERLRTRLPVSMIPAQFVFVDRLPRTPNGKLDRRSLPVPEAGPVTSGVPPANELEARIAALWCETLALAHVGVEDNFFDLGGHSLLIVRLHRRVCELSSGPVSLTDLFRFPTVRSLARHLAAESKPGLVDDAARRGSRRRKAAAARSIRTFES